VNHTNPPKKVLLAMAATAEERIWSSSRNTQGGFSLIVSKIESPNDVREVGEDQKKGWVAMGGGGGKC